MKRSFLSISMIAVMSLAAAAMTGCGTQTETGHSVNTEISTYADSTEKPTDENVYVPDKIDGQTEFAGETKSDTSSGKTSAGKSSIQEELALIESKTSEINDKLQNENLTQTDMNQLTADIYKLWDDELNKVWAYLKDTLDDSTMSKLKEEESSWIKEKDNQVKAAGKAAGGGSMQSMLENNKAAELTRSRVYELVKYY